MVKGFNIAVYEYSKSNAPGVGQRFAVKSPTIAPPVPEGGSEEYIDRCIIFMDGASEIYCCS